MLHVLKDLNPHLHALEACVLPLDDAHIVITCS